MFEEHVLVTRNERITSSFYLMGLRSSRMARAALPGQFLQICAGDGIDPFLPRPMSIYRVRGRELQILYVVVGKGTERLSKARRGTRLLTWGPLGSTFQAPRGKQVALVGGGVGIAPLVFWAARARASKLFFGIRSKSDRLSARSLGVARRATSYASNDGSIGHKGYVTDLFDRWAKTAQPESWVVLTCGPDPMLKKVIATAQRFGLSGQASLEETMACGVGACLGCVRFLDGRQKTVCRDGPVFSFSDLSA